MRRRLNTGDNSGLVDLFSTKPVEGRILYIADAAALQQWVSESILPFWVMVALHSRVDPRSICSDRWQESDTLEQFLAIRHGPDPVDRGRSLERRLADNLAAAMTAIEANQLALFAPPAMVYRLTESVRVQDFHTWSVRAALPVIEGWPTREEAYGSGSHRGDVREWPWGSHETELLRKLAEAASRFWASSDEGGVLDPDDSTTAPTNPQVVAWLMGRDVSKTIAEAMATILRRDGLKTGRRAVS